tara:strand:+ start:479 stop:610 length:132 start_codon:yes stop_codon:yes gene_type:complete
MTPDLLPRKSAIFSIKKINMAMPIKIAITIENLFKSEKIESFK